MTTMAISPSTGRWDGLRGARARAWAATEEQQRPTYAETLRHVAIRRGDRVLDAYPGPEELVDAMLTAGGGAAVTDPERELGLRAAILCSLAHCRRPDGSYRVSNEWHVVIAGA
jgi:hypothetical protein